MSNRAIAHRLGVSEKAIRKQVGASKPTGSEQLGFAALAAPAAAGPPASCVSPAPSASDEGARPMPAGDGRTGDCDPNARADDDLEPVPMSLDGDASDRSFDRQLAYLGLLDDAAPLFREGVSLPGVGVLLALPCLVDRAASDQS